MPRWNQRQAFRKATQRERYPELWARLEALNVGIDPSHSMIDTIDILAAAVEERDDRIEQLEIEASVI